MNITPNKAIRIFFAFAVAYFLSTLIRAITATLAPVLTAEFSITARDLGLLAGGYFLGFSLTQLPLGGWLDRHGPKRVLLCLMLVAELGCLLFASATSFTGLFVARILCGVGVSACLMAPLTGYRRWLHPSTQMRANSWMLMTGSMGMLASTLPIQWLVPLVGWRAVFWLLTGLLFTSMLLIVWVVPSWRKSTEQSADLTAAGHAQTTDSRTDGSVWRNPYFRKMVPIGFFSYGGLLAVQTLWAAPWMIKVAGFNALEAAAGMFWINAAMLFAFLLWGWVNPWLSQRGLQADWLIVRGLPTSFVVLASLILLGPTHPQWAIVQLALYCVCCTFVALAQPAVALAFPSALAGRALSAFNLVIFSGVFAVQWGIGLAIDGFVAFGLPERMAFQAAMAVFLVLSVVGYLRYLYPKDHNARTVTS